jgi:heat shock protein 5
MVRRSRRASAPTAWTTALYLLLIFIAPLAFLNTASADQDVSKENYGPGMSFV